MAYRSSILRRGPAVRRDAIHDRIMRDNELIPIEQALLNSTDVSGSAARD